MMLNEPQDYTLELVDAGSYRLHTEAGVGSFSKPSTVRGLAKLYTVSDAGVLFYVGIAEQPMSSRLRVGFNASGKGGYHGYKWKGLGHRLALSVWTAQVSGRPASLREMETVEAEVAFRCREQSGQWPAYQHEIHFYPSLSEHRSAAQRIYDHAAVRLLWSASRQLSQAQACPPGNTSEARTTLAPRSPPASPGRQPCHKGAPSGSNGSQ
jgi:hypothetical protein